MRAPRRQSGAGIGTDGSVRSDVLSDVMSDVAGLSHGAAVGATSWLRLRLGCAPRKGCATRTLKR